MIKHITTAVISSFFFTANAYALDSLIEHMQKAIEFEENNYNILANSEKFTENRLSESKTFAKFSKTIEKTKFLLDKLKRYQRGEFSPNALFRDAFKLRFDQIGMSSCDFFSNLKLGLKDGHEICDSYWSITAESINKLKRKESADAHWNQIIAQTSLDRYQLMSNLIKEILWDMKQRERSLTEDNKILLRCARTLHPLLRGQVELLDNPQSATYENFECEDNVNCESELELCSHYLVPKATVNFPDLTLGASCFGLHCSVMVTTHEFLHLPSEIKKTGKCVSSRSIDPKLPTFDFPRELKLFSAEEDTITIEEIVTDSTNSDEISPENGSSENEFEAKSCSSNSDYCDKDEPAENHQVEFTHKSIALDHREEVEDLSKPEEPEIDIALDDENDDDFEKNEEIDPRKVHLAFQAIKAKQLNLDAPRVNSRENPLRNWVVSKLKKRQVNWLKKLLSNKTKTISYENFSAVWKRLNGKNTIVSSKKGSSHFKLLNRQGEEVGGIFTHGSGQEYWGSAVHDIKQHFIALGLSEDLLDDIY